MQCDNVLLARVHTVEHRTEVIKRVVITHHHQNVFRTYSHGFRRKIITRLDIELIEFCVGAGPLARDLLGNLKHGEDDHGKRQSGNCGDFFGEQVYSAEGDEGQSDQSKAERDLGCADPKIQRHLVFPLPWLRIAEDQHRQPLHREAPHHAERIRFAEDEHVAAAQDDREQLKHNDQVQDAIRCAELLVRLPEPLRQNAVFRDAVQDSVGSDDRGVNSARQHEHPYGDHENMKRKLEP